MEQTPLELLAAAFASPYGIIVDCEDPVALRQRLYVERKRDPDFASISICVSPTDPARGLWLVKKGADT